MMCSKCKEAGDVFATGKIDRAKRKHLLCEFPDCTCQHMTSKRISVTDGTAEEISSR